MQKIFLLVFAIIVAPFPLIAQTRLDPGDYFRLDVRKYAEDGESYIGVSPEIRNGIKGPLASAMAKYPRRFRYLLLNRSVFNGQYDQLYPDTNRINQLYKQSLARDARFKEAFEALARPFTDPSATRATFGIDEMMKVAARFFYCDGMAKDSSIQSHICINLNGLKPGSFTKDLFLLEAFCFEAIFANYRTAGNQEAPFVTNFKKHIKAGEKQERTRSFSTKDFIARVREYCFLLMEQDESLKKALLGYYTAHKKGVPFTLLEN